MTKMTLTEALAEVKLCFNKIKKKERFIAEHLVQLERLKDPLESEGGSKVVVEKQIQSITDLSERIVKIRAAITQANQANTIELNGTSRTIGDWLVIRRELLQRQEQFVDHLRNIILSARSQVVDEIGRKREQKLAQEKTEDLIVHLDENDLLRMIEGVTEVRERLDAQLSLKNARIEVEIAD